METCKNLIETLTKQAILVTGATGMLGQNVISTLLKMNDDFSTEIQVVAHARNFDKANKLFAKHMNRSDFELTICDITEISLTNKVDYIIHTAGVTGGSKQHVDFPVRTITTALEGTKKVLDLAVEKDCKGVVYLSSLEVYGNTGMNKKEIYEKEGGYIDPLNVRSSYSESKRMCECMCVSYMKQYGIPVYIARLTATFGFGVDYFDNRVFAQFARSVIEKKDIVLKSTGETVRNYCDAEDAARAFLMILANGIPGEAYNIANMNTEISIKNLAIKLIELYPDSGIKLKFELNSDVQKLGYNTTMRNVLNSEKLMDIGWRPIYNLDDMLRRLIKFMKDNKEESEAMNK